MYTVPVGTVVDGEMYTGLAVPHMAGGPLCWRGPLVAYTLDIAYRSMWGRPAGRRDRRRRMRRARGEATKG